MARGAGGLLQPQPWGLVPGAVGRVGTRSPIPIRGHAFWVPWVGLGPHPRRERARPAWRQRSLPGHVEKARGAAGARPPGSPSLIPLNFTPHQDIQHTEDFLIKPESRVAQLDTSQWPLLLKVGRVLLNLVARPCSRSFCPLPLELLPSV